MRYIIAITVSVVLSILMFAFATWMLTLERQWAAQNVALPPICVAGISLMYFIRTFWCLLIALFFGASLTVAALWPRRANP
jgi:hypothetical protein